MGFWAAFLREHFRGVEWVWPTGRGQYFFGFAHDRGVWVKTGAGPQDEGFCKLSWLQKPASKRPKQTAVFNFVAGNATKTRVSEFSGSNKSDPRLFTFFISYLYFSDSEISCCTCLGGPDRKAAELQKHYKKRGFGALRTKLRRAETWEIVAFKNGVPVCVC